jgi:hypothetical protein
MGKALRNLRRVVSAICFVAAAILLATPWVLPFLGLHTTFRWQHAEGKVVESGVKETRTGEGLRYGPAIVYEYRFAEKRFVNNRLDWVDFFQPDPEKARKAALRHPVGSRVNVLVNPASPGESMLEHRRFWEILMLILLPVALICGGVWLWRH